MSLAQALDALGRGDQEAALASLLEVWRAHAVPDIAVIVEALGRAIDATLPALDPLSPNAHAEWLFVDGAGRGRDVGRLVTALGATPETLPPTTYEQLTTKLTRLAARPSDPRFAMIGASLLVSGHVIRHVPLADVAFRLCVVAGDRQLVTQLENSVALRGDAAIFQQAIDTLRVMLPPPKPLAPSDFLLVDEIARAIMLRPISPLAPRHDALADALLADVLGHPEDDGPRAVYGDHLLGKGDPRGELIALQLAPSLDAAGHARVRALVEAHPAWVAPLGPILAEYRFERGFLAIARVDAAYELRIRSFVPWLEHPLWQTVRVLDTPDRALVTQTALRSLERAAIDADGLHVLAGAPAPLPLVAAHGPTIELGERRVWSGIKPGKRADWAAALRVGALTSLRTLSLIAHDPRPLDWLLESKLLLQIRWLDLFAADPTTTSIGAWLDAVAHLGGLDRLTVRYAGGFRLLPLTLQLDRVRGSRSKKPRWAATLHAHDAYEDSVYFAQVRSALAVSGFPRKDVRIAHASPALRDLLGAFFERVEPVTDPISDELTFTS